MLSVAIALLGGNKIKISSSNEEVNRSLSSRQTKKQKLFPGFQKWSPVFSVTQLPEGCGNWPVLGNPVCAGAAGCCSSG